MATKGFKNNPAVTFFSSAVEAEASEQPEKAMAAIEETSAVSASPQPVRYRLDPRYVEVKSKRVSCLLRPSLVDGAKAAAKDMGISFNEYLNRALEQAIAEGLKE